VSGINNLADQPRIPFGNPAQNEKGPLDLTLIAQVKDSPRVRLNPAIVAAPLLSIHNVGKGLDMEVVFNVH
jgi:hypothetical protein